MAEAKKRPRPRILCVDDDIFQRIIVRENLRKYYDVVLAENGKIALEFLRQELVDIILLDISMPQMDGFEVITRLKEDERLKNIPVIFMTGMDSPNEIKKGLELGANDYLTKPLNHGEFRARINTQVKILEANNLRLEIAQTKTVQSMIVSLHHEINNPLTVLTVQLGMMKRKVDGHGKEFEEMSQAIQNIEVLLHKMRQVEDALK